LPKPAEQGAIVRISRLFTGRVAAQAVAQIGYPFLFVLLYHLAFAVASEAVDAGAAILVTGCADTLGVAVVHGEAMVEAGVFPIICAMAVRALA